MDKLIPVSRKKLVKKLKTFEFEGPYKGGKHAYMVKANLVLTIPNPHQKEIGVDLLSRILKQAKIRREKWVEEK